MTKRYSYKFDLQFLWEKISIDEHSKVVIKMGVWNHNTSLSHQGHGHVSIMFT